MMMKWNLDNYGLADYQLMISNCDMMVINQVNS
jgi:hypothetical protein